MIIAAILLFATQPAPAPPLNDAQIEKLVAAVSVDNDPLEASITLSSEKVLSEAVDNQTEVQNYYFSISQDRKSKVRHYYISVSRFYADERIRFYRTFNYIGTQGQIELPIIVADRQVSRCFPASNICTFRENFALEIPAKDFLAMAGKQSNLDPWVFKFTSKSGSETRYFMFPAEAKALIIAADRLLLSK